MLYPRQCSVYAGLYSVKIKHCSLAAGFTFRLHLSALLTSVVAPGRQALTFIFATAQGICETSDERCSGRIQHLIQLRLPGFPLVFWVFFKFIYLFLAVLGLCCCARAFSSCGERGLLFIAARGLLTAVASLVAEHGL